jgi:MoxR-like ATPase
MLQRLQFGNSLQTLQPCITLLEVEELRRHCANVRVEPPLQQYILALVRATREDEEITLGVSPRGTVTLQRATQALAFLQGRDYTIPDDVKFLAPYVLCHRLIATGGRNPKAIVERLLATTAVP